MNEILYIWKWATDIEIILIGLVFYLWVMGYAIMKSLMYPPYMYVKEKLAFHQIIVLILWPLTGIIWLLGLMKDE